MILHSAFLRGKVARRFFVLFLACALLPIAGAAFLSLHQVTEHLHLQNQRRLHQAAKRAAMSIFERLLLLELQMKVLAAHYGGDAGWPGRGTSGDFVQVLKQRFVGVAVMTEGGERRDVVGRLEDLPETGGPPARHLAAGNIVLSWKRQAPLPPRVFMQTAIDPRRPRAGRLVGEIATPYLWGIGDQNTLPPMTDMCVVDHRATIFICSLPGEVAFPPSAIGEMTTLASGQFEWRHQGREYIASYWSMPLRFQFSSPQWSVILIEARDRVVAPMAQFRWTFVLVLLFFIGVVLLLSISQIRRSLVPLERIRAGTQRVAAGDFGTRVAVRSGDEFEELADSFNAMATRLERQFHTLATIAEIDRAILSTFEVDEIGRTLLARIGGLFPGDPVAVTILSASAPLEGRTYTRGGEPAGAIEVYHTELTAEGSRTLWSNPDHLVVRPGDGRLDRLIPTGPSRSVLVLPVLAKGTLAGVLSIGSPGLPEHGDEDRARARQLADQVAVALSNAREVAERRRAEESLQESNRRLETALADLQATQQQVLQQERLRALGQMASGIAHDFNNALSPIVGYSEMLLKRPECLEDRDKVTRYLRSINTAGRDAASVVRRLREFYRSREAGEVFTALSLNALVEQAIELTRPRWKDQALASGGTITIDTDLGEIPPVSGNASEVREVLTNLIINAADAMPLGGCLGFRTRPEGARVVLEVSDTGVGMTEEVRRRCLEPFFSTKGERGTGLGLSMVYGIVKRHGGTLDIVSVVGRGTTFTIGLPARQNGEDAAPGEEPDAPSPPLRVLLVDDDPPTLDVLHEWLTTDHHVVETARNGREGLERFHQGSFELVVTGHAMPEMSGEQLTRVIKALSPTTPVILVSGFGELIGDSGEVPPGVDVVLGKPVTVAMLRQAIRRCAPARARNRGTTVASS